MLKQAVGYKCAYLMYHGFSLIFNSMINPLIYYTLHNGQNCKKHAKKSIWHVKINFTLMLKVIDAENDA